jgi:hypothetical protein
MPEPTTRLAALRSGQVDWIEVPPPDAIPQLKGGGFTIALNSYPHNWTHTLRLDKEPWSNKLVRKAANYAIDRVGICKNLPERHLHPGHRRRVQGPPWFGKPKETYEYNPAKAKELLKQAGFDGTRHPAKAVQLISTSGSGQMLPLAMNELIQKNLKDGRDRRRPAAVEWNTLLTRWRAGFKTPDNEGLNAWNISWNFLEPWSGFGRFFHSKSVVPVSVNTMPYINPEADKLIDEAERTFDVAKQNEILASPARGGRRRRAVDLRRARPESTSAVAQGEGLRAAAELVRRPDGGDRAASVRSPVWTYVGRRLLLAIPTLLGASIIVFRDGAPGPGDSDRGGDAGRVEQGRDRGHQSAPTGFDKPLPGAVPRLARGRRAPGAILGRSIATRRAVISTSADAPGQLPGLALSARCWPRVGVGSGLLAAFRQGRSSTRSRAWGGGGCVDSALLGRHHPDHRVLGPAQLAAGHGGGRRRRSDRIPASHGAAHGRLSR